MIVPNALKVQRFLNDLVRGVKREKLSDASMREFHRRLQAYVSSVHMPVLEYTRDTIEPIVIGSLPLIWKISKESPIDMVYASAEFDGRAYFAYETQSYRGQTWIKEFVPPTEFAFLRDKGLYVARGNIKEGKFSVNREEIYLPEDITGLF